MLLILGPDRLLYRGPPVDGARHRHHALQLALSLGAPLSLSLDEGDTPQQAAGIAVAADTPHQLLGGAPQIALLYLEPESADGQRLQQALAGPARSYQPPAALIQALMNLDASADAATLQQDFAALCADWLSALGAPAAAPAVAMDVRIADTLAQLAAHPEQQHPAAVLAARVQLSPDRLMHLFAEATGIPLRSYALWLRLKVALRTALAGATLTEAAHAAGFADSAHLSHSFKAMFGLPPRFLFERRDALTVRYCG